MKKIKILALMDDKGSKYHRVALPLSQLDREKYEVSFLNEKFVNEPIVKGYDVIYFHWIQKTKCEYLSVWRKKYGFKIIQDVDDYWVLPYNHPLKQRLESSIWQLKDQMILADYVFVSTEFLEDKVKEFNKQIILRKNYIPNGIAQYSVEFRTPDKISIGICGSISHVNDWMSIKSQINKVINDDRFSNCEFVVTGYSDKSKDIWDKIANLFLYKRGGKVIRPTIIHSLPPNKYMQLYNHLDIVLAPLEEGDFNVAKSNLKILECAIKSPILVSGDIYRLKDNPAYINVEGSSYHKELLNLLDKEKLTELKREFQGRNLQINSDYAVKYNINRIFDEIFY